MRLTEFYNPEDDKFTQIKPDDTRKPRFTLKQLNKLRKHRDLQQADIKKRDLLVGIMYGQPAVQ